MKNQSKMLQYLADSGVLSSSEEDIRNAKILWRRQYKKEWRQNSKKNKELRPGFNSQQFEEIAIRAKLYGLNPTSYARELILSAQENSDLIPNKDKLLYILQAISMAEIALKKGNNSLDANALLLQAEETLLTYLNFK